jgi:NCS1 family nucleobase:cation symporter-1
VGDAVSSDLGTGTSSATEGSWPVLPAERSWGARALFGISVSAAIATWCFLIGGYVAYYLPAGVGTIVMIAGALVGILMIFLATVPVATKYGIDSVASSKPQLGTRGSWIALFALYTTVIGWNCLLLVFLGRAAAEIVITLGIAGDGARPIMVSIFAAIAVVVVWWILRGGPDTVRDTGPWIAIGVLVLGVIILVLLVTKAGLGTIMDAVPAYASGNKTLDISLGFEVMVASVLSWWPYAGGMVRLCPSAKTAQWPVVFGLGLPVGLVSIIGLWSALAVPDSAGDPTVYLTNLGGPVVGVISLLFIILANVGTVMVGVYVTAVGLKQIGPMEKVSWNGTTGITLLPVLVIVILFPNYFFDHIGTFLSFMDPGRRLLLPSSATARHPICLPHRQAELVPLLRRGEPGWCARADRRVLHLHLSAQPGELRGPRPLPVRLGKRSVGGGRWPRLLDPDARSGTSVQARRL